MKNAARTPLPGALLALLVANIGMADESPAPHWAYSGPESPAHWGALDPHFSACALGHTQSPINIVHAKPADLPVLNFDYAAAPLNIIDNGHSVQVTAGPGGTLRVGDATYTLTQFHFHHPSEEHINGKGFPLVAHLVHQDAQGHLAVVAVLFKEGKANPLIAALWANIPAEKGKAEQVPAVAAQPSELLPAGHGYFTYSGSLTTPPCTEGVTWYVLKSHPTVSAQQIAAFAKLYPKDARPIQPANGRSILQTR